MKWSSLRKDLRQKVGLSGSQPQPASYLYPSLSPAAEHGGAGAPESATAFGDGSPIAEGTKSELGPPRQSSFEVDDMRASEDKQEKELLDNGEYLIRPYLEPSEKIRFRYNCEHVMGPDKHDGIFLLGEFCLYVIENFYINDSGCICEKLCEDELSVTDKALGVKKDISNNSEFQLKASSTWSTTVDICWWKSMGI
ncbi:hypothetical protein BHM03_00054145 [Ensete ventricosum]|nr:hypothetical protein BHM03_00054145 [Ensete ventricosum]